MFSKTSPLTLFTSISTSYLFYNQPLQNQSTILTDTTYTLINNLTEVDQTSWNVDSRLNDGARLQVGDLSSQLLLCQDSQILSPIMGLCLPANRALQVRDSMSGNFGSSPAVQSQYSFGLWIRVDNAIQNMTVLTIGGDSRVNLTEKNDQINWSSISDDFNLTTSIASDKWALLAGTYEVSGAKMYFNGTLIQSGVVTTPSSYSLQLLHNITTTTSRIKLFVLSFWNTVLPYRKLSQLNGRFVLERENTVYFFHFGQTVNKQIVSWIDPSDYYHLNTSMVLSESDIELLPLQLTCDLGGYLENGECRFNKEFMCFKAATSEMSFDTSALGLQPFTHSLLFWTHLTGNGVGSLDIKLHEGFSTSVSLQGSISIYFGTFQLIPTTIIPSQHQWYLVKLSVANSSQYDILLSKANGEAIADDRFLKGLSSPPSPSLSKLTIQAIGISGATVCLNSLSIYSFAIPNQASIQISSMPFSKKVNIQPLLSLNFESKYPQILQLATHTTVSFEQSALSFQTLTQDKRGDALLQCDLSNGFYSVDTDSCQDEVLCIDSHSQQCSANEYAVLCQNLYYSSLGKCVTECPSASVRVQKFCFTFFSVGDAEFTLAVDQFNTLTISFNSPIIFSEYSQILKELQLQITGPRSDYNVTIESSTPLINDEGKVVSIVSPLLIKHTIRQKEDVIIQISLLSNSERIYQSTLLKPQDPPQFKTTLKLYDQILYLAEYGGVILFTFFTISALISQSSFSPLWTTIYPCQFIAYTVLIDSPLPANIQRALDFLLISQGYFSWFDHLPNLLRNRNILPYDELMKQEALNRNFQMNGFNSSSFFLLYERKILILQFGFLYLVSVVILAWTFDQFKKWQVNLNFSKCLTTRLFRCFDLDFWIRLFLFLLLQLVIISLITSIQIFQTINKHVIDFVLFAFFALLISFFILLLVIGLCSINRKFKEKHDKWKGKVLTENIKVQGKRLKCKTVWPYFFIMQRFLFPLALIYFENNASFSGFSISALLLFIFLFLIITQPFKSKIYNILEFINRLFILAIVGLSLYLAQIGYSMSQQASFQIGTIMVGIVVLFLLLNVIILFFLGCSRIFKSFKKKKEPEIKRKVAALELQQTVDFQELQQSHSAINRLDRSTDELRGDFKELKPAQIQRIPTNKPSPIKDEKTIKANVITRRKEFQTLKEGGKQEQEVKQEIKEEVKKEEEEVVNKKQKDQKKKSKKKQAKEKMIQNPKIEEVWSQNEPKVSQTQEPKKAKFKT